MTIKMPVVSFVPVLPSPLTLVDLCQNQKRKVQRRKTKQTIGQGSGVLTDVANKVTGQVPKIHFYQVCGPFRSKLNVLPCPLLNCSLLGGL